MRVSKTFKGLNLGFQNFSSVVRGRWNVGGLNLNLSKSGLSVSNKNALGTFNFRRPKSSSATIGGIQVRGEAGAIIRFVGMLISLLGMLASLVITIVPRIALIFAWLGQLIWNGLLFLVSLFIFVTIDVPRQLIFGVTKEAEEVIAPHKMNNLFKQAISVERSPSTPKEDEADLSNAIERPKGHGKGELSSDGMKAQESNAESFADYLGKAASKGHEASEAVRSGKLDKAWHLYHEQKTLYLRHAERHGFTQEQTVSLDASVHENLANILRLEGKHDEALIHILYWVIAQSGKPIKGHSRKLSVYFKRCKFSNVSIEEALVFSNSSSPNQNLESIKSKVSEWRYRG